MLAPNGKDFGKLACLIQVENWLGPVGDFDADGRDE